MAVVLVGSGGLFTRLGSLGSIINAENLYRGSTLPGKVATLAGNWSGDLPDIGNLYSALASRQSAQGGWLAYLQGVARATLINQVNADTPLSSLSVGPALAVLISQMLASSDTVQANTVGASATPGGSNTGNPNLIVSTPAGNGLPLQLIFPETLTATVTRDSQSGGAPAGSETISVRGQAGSTNPLDFAYPTGSNAGATLTAIDASLSNGGNNRQILNNGDFETFTVANTPDNWTITVGAAGTQVFQSSVAGTFYTGASSVKFVGDSSTLTAIQQQMGVGNSARIFPFTVFGFNLWLKCDVVPAAGVLELALVDGAGTIIQDGAGNNNALTFNLTGATTSFAPLGGFFRTPRILPPAVNLRVRLSTALSTGTSLFLDRLAFTQPGSLYIGGPYAAAFSGSTPLLLGDTFAIAATNNRAGKFVCLFDQLFGMRTLGLQLPTVASSPTIPDSLAA